ncbi:DUF6153 family protein [Streptomyces fuscichromogenes]|uniref:DUF6153 family protein n=1 Tax=Streptomyces fuscichromogenes TaxID=1324013 RepID=UPI003819F188
MRPTEQPAPRPPYRRWRALLVLGLLTGLLGMHALAPDGIPGPHGGHRPAASATTVTVTTDDGCSDGDSHRGDHRAHHADATCVSGAVSGGPALPALVPDPVPALAGDCLALSRQTAAPDGARAPPDLAELQLLRI